MRLLIVSSEFPPGPGGIGTHAYQLARHLHELGWEIHVVANQDYASDDEIRIFNESQPFSLSRIGNMHGRFKNHIQRPWMISRLIRNWRPTMILASGDRIIYMTAWIAHIFRIPYVVIEHGRIAHLWEFWLKRWSLERSSMVVCVSRYTRERLLRGKIFPKATRVILNGADATLFKILPRKGQEVVIRALPMILKRDPKAHYLIAGMPDKQKEFERLALNLGVHDHVHFLGRVDKGNLIRCLNVCDIFVMMSRHTAREFEGYGIAVVEAALCNKPSIVSDESGLSEAIKDGETGFCVPVDDGTTTAERVLTLLADEELRLKMGKAARQRALSEQTWAHRVAEYDKFLRELLNSVSLSSS